MSSVFIDTFIKKHQLSGDFLAVAERYLVPLAECFLRKSTLSKEPFFAGINGCQGSGKSTISAFIQAYLNTCYQLNVVNISLDDFYLTQHQRLSLANNVHPLLKTRGVPGTHDVDKLFHVLSRLKKNSGELEVPRFSKLNDNPCAPYRISLPVDLVLIEGWCWGVEAQHHRELIQPCNTVEQVHDKDLVWRQYVNTCLLENYTPLYAFVDFWLYLKAPSFDCVYQWRLQQEEKLRASQPITKQSATMSNKQVQAFVILFQRLTEHALATMGDKADVTLYFNQDRQVLYCDSVETNKT